jgi:2-keto-4-pentenoate hydratase/2-oxohepta-3-ene-1,7-dioic acid hydratase in catechol pathway
MKILRFDDDRIGVLKPGDRVVDVSELVSYRQERGPQRVMEVLIETFDSLRPELARMVASREGAPLASVVLRVPIPRPSKCLGAFQNYLDDPERPLASMPNEFFFKAPELLGPEEAIELRDLQPVKEITPEAELAFVIGKPCKNAPESEAMGYVFGYVPFFDVSARGLVRRSLLVPKGQDTFGPCGPWITTADEVPDPHKLNIKSWINGELRQDFCTDMMAHKIPDQIAWLSRQLTLQPGDVVATGTRHKGFGALNVGDTLAIEIERLGRARFFVRGDMPFKDTKRVAALRKPDPLPPGLSITPI